MDIYKYQAEIKPGVWADIAPGTAEDLDIEKWWELEEWFFFYNDKKIYTPAGELAALHVDICDLKLEIQDYENSKKRQHKNHVRNLKETVKFLSWLFKYCEQREIGTTAFYSLLATDNIDEGENGI